ncbi:lipopolysaccharide biosynthesis protein [Pedobacter hiemivivus]|uniref:Lipopolysaccharide biosynthesis protein n=1 Tax=Pedobacter hiemivivus TaxID=2530454 RepID=A0A4U1G2B1_9SPHI|nr:Wzz/FepE/Etk N-terminal domain-containing protein [Pedobacter hiemivivus]TKC56939.1 lipopolysaccharide biosynthesis protein [Pedobacter hiemivivus]
MNSEDPNKQSINSDEISLKQLFFNLRDWCNYLLSKWVIIVLIGGLGGILGFTYAFFKKPMYTATTTFVLEDAGNGASALGSLGGLASMVGIDVGGGGGIFQGDNILELYKSRTMIARTLLTEIDYLGKKQLLIDRYIDMNGLRDKWKGKPELNLIRFKKLDSGLSESNFTRLQDSILLAIVKEIGEKYLVVGKPDKKLSIIKAEVRALDEIFAKDFNDQIVKNVNDFYVQTKTKKSIENVEILQEKVDSVRSVMDGAINKAAAVSDATPNLNVTRQIQRIAPIQRSQFNAETNKAILAELVKNLELSKISLHKETPLIQIIDSPIFPLTIDKMGRMKGIALGAILAVFVVISFFTLRLIFKHILKEN